MSRRITEIRPAAAGPVGRGKERGQHAFLAVLRVLASSPLTLSLSASLSFSPFSPEVTTSTLASERKRGRYREENDVLQNVVTPERRSEGRCCSGGCEDRRSRPRSFRPVRSPFFHDATRPRGRRWHGGEALAATFPDHHSRNNNNHRDTRVIGTWRRGSCRGTKLDKAPEERSMMMGEGREGGEQE